MRVGILFFISLLTIHAGRTQTYLDIVKLDYNESFQRSFDTGPGKARFSEVVADFTLPLVMKGGSSIITGFGFERNFLGYEDIQLNQTLDGVTLKCGLNLNHANAWSGTYVLLPRYTSEKNRLGGEDFQLGLLAWLRKDLSIDKNFRIGLYANNDLFGPMIVPLFGYYRKTVRWETNLLFPASGEFNYILAKSFRFGLKFNGFGKSFALSNGNYMAKANNEVGAIAYLIPGKWVGFISIGTSVGRSFREYRQGDKMDVSLSIIRIGDDRVQLNDDFQDGLFIRAGVSLRVSTVRKGIDTAWAGLN